VTLEKLMKLCGSSSEDDWNFISPGALYLDRFLSIETRLREDDPDLTYQLHHEEHHSRAAYKPDLSIGIAWGMYAHPPLPGERPEIFHEEWATQFPDDRPTMHWVDFFYCGGLVDRQYYVYIDARCKMPLPQLKFAPGDALDGKVTALTITPWQRDFFRVLNALETTIDYDGYLRRVGFEVSPESS
jgi:hypothetical protein